MCSFYFSGFDSRCLWCRGSPGVHWFYVVCCWFPGFPLRMVPCLRDVGVDSPVLNSTVMGYGGGTFSDCRNANFPCCVPLRHWYYVDGGTRGGLSSTRGLGPTMTARGLEPPMTTRGQSVGIPIGMLPQTLIVSRLDQLSRLGARIWFFLWSIKRFPVCGQRFF
jgi:hypothetical protein